MGEYLRNYHMMKRSQHSRAPANCGYIFLCDSSRVKCEGARLPGQTGTHKARKPAATIAGAAFLPIVTPCKTGRRQSRRSVLLYAAAVFDDNSRQLTRGEVRDAARVESDS